MTHTPGPWIATKYVITETDGNRIADVWNADQYFQAAEANARLIAAAPELLEALKAIRFGLTNERNCVWPTVKSWTKKERDEAMLEIARAAIAKAEGK